MGLLGRFRRAPLLRSGPLLLLPAGTDLAEVDALVASFAPSRRRDGVSWVLDDGLVWTGPLELAPEDALADELPVGYPLAFVAVARRSRGDGLAQRLADRAFARSDARADERLRAAWLADGVTQDEIDRLEAEAEEVDRRFYPDGRPQGLEADAWALVCGIARRLGGTCRLADGTAQVPPLPAADPTYAEVRSRVLLPAAEVAALARDHLGALDVVPEEPDGITTWTLRGGGTPPIEVMAEQDELDAELRARGLGDLDPLALYDSAGGRPVTYSISARGNDRAGLLGLCAALVDATDGIVLDAEGFPVGVPRR